MIQINMLQVLRTAHPEGDYNPRIDSAIEEVKKYFIKPEDKALLETI